ncbi:flavin reductase family protein [Kordia sp. YSTF-M3]|uniref:Flavin reductase family protein n=1 Tax=Kordia aestuariivivens TaxID=2759037 RepID=A0ABR7Q616_9FLAO|nr:flavin reductase family protein [Kordia aestuariivivens]MBC8754016.1 flavin reductase family protein [Kordia aestuariivivens]
MATITRDDIDNMEKLYRINLINSCSGYKSANLIGTQSENGQTNVAVFSSVTHLGSNPPLLGFITRPAVVPRDTYENIRKTGIFTINHIHQNSIQDAHHTSAKYPKDVSEFDQTDLKAEYKEDFLAPYVKGCHVQVGMRYVNEYVIEENDTILVIGTIEHLHINDELLETDGFINLAKAKTATINGLDGYAIPQQNTRYPYQRPKQI